MRSRESVHQVGGASAGLATLVAGALLLTSAPGGARTEEGERYETVPITVTATRTSQGRPVSSVPGSVTVIPAEEIEKRARSTDDFGEILAEIVPGLGPSSESLTNFGQNLRGREFLILIDGVPQNTPLRNVSKQLRSIHPSAIERIEVIRGSVATYGFGATGGIVNIITRAGDPDAPRFRTELGTSDLEDYSVEQGIQGSTQDTTYTLNLSARDTGGSFNADGRRIAPDAFLQGGGLDDAREFNVQGQLSRQLTARQRLRLAANYYRIRQDTDFVMDDDPRDPAFAVPGDPQGKDPGTENLSLTIDHTLEALLGGTLSSQLYFQDFETRFSFFGDRQTALESEKVGARLAHERPFGSVVAVYGADFLRDETGQPVIFGEGELSTPFIEQVSYAPFVQLELPIGERWLLRGGVRHEELELEVDDYTTVFISPDTVQGGRLDYSETVFNLGAVYFIDDRQEVFASFSQGFSVADIGRVLRTTSASSVEAVNPEAQVVDNYELGWRGAFQRLDASASVFFNTSDLGTSFDEDLNLLRQKEEIYGFELTADYRVSDPWTLGGTFSWQEGKADTDDDGSVDAYLPVTRISPPKLTAYAEYAPTERWDARVQLTRFFDRDRDEYSADFGGVDTDAYTVVDLSLTAALGPGRMALGVNNLFNQDFIVPVGRAFGALGEQFDQDFRQDVPGRGRVFSLSYAIQY